MVVSPKGLRIGRALKSAARFPGRVTRSGGNNSENSLAAKPGEEPIVLLRLQVVGCNDILAKDKSGTSDPYVVARLLGQQFSTPVAKKTLNPTFAAHDATFNFKIYLSQVDRLGVLELVIWDKDIIKKDYIGEVSLRFEDWFKGTEALAFDHERNFEFEVPVVSTKASTPACGTMRVKLGFAPPSELHQFPNYQEIYQEIQRKYSGARPSLSSAPPTEGIGTVRSHLMGPEFEDDVLSSDDEEEDDDDAGELSTSPGLPPNLEGPQSIEPVPVPVDDSPQSLLRPDQIPPSVVGGPSKTSFAGGLKKAIRRPPFSPRLTSTSLPDSNVGSPSSSSEKKRRPKFKRAWNSKAGRGEYNLSTLNDMLGIVMLEIVGAENLPRYKNMTRTGWDMDPFVVISFGKKVFRTRVIRHSLNPKWDEKLLFHVRRYETQFNVKFSILDWDKLTSNDNIAECAINISEFLTNAPKPNENGIYPPGSDGTHDMKEFRIPLKSGDDRPFDSLTATPTIIFRAKYQPYAALRQTFWRQCMKQYDADDTGTLSAIEITSMLDSLGSTLSQDTIKEFFSKYEKNHIDEELTVEEAINCLEHEIALPKSQRKTLNSDEGPPISGLNTPGLMGSSDQQPILNLDKLDFSGPPHISSQSENISQPPSRKPSLPPTFPSEPSQLAVSELTVPTGIAPEGSPLDTPKQISVSRPESNSSSDADESSGSNGSEDTVERVINVKSCPFCHRPRLNKKGEVDILTHIALCASQDWSRVDKIVVGNFVTPSQAQRKWFMKVISKVSSGAYQLGANSANIIVQNRMTGQLEEEKMQVYVRLGIRLLYKGAKGRMEGARARRLLKSLSIKQGKKFDDPASAADIPAFIAFHKLNTDEILGSLESFKTFNEFFYRKLKPDARPVMNPDDPYTLVSGADCRMMAFESVTEATKLWIKGREFSVGRLLGEAYKDQASRYVGGALAIFRLAPQDYHRFHSPVDGVIGPMTYIAGEYYTVNPQAIRTGLDVYGENARKIVPIDSPQFGRVMAVCVGAMMVGSIITTVSEGDEVKRGEEFGYFAFGGSTIVLLFEKDVVQWDEDLVLNGRACLETLVRVGMGIGRSVKAG